MSAVPASTPDRCPLCGQANQCAMEIERVTGDKQPPCWCTQADFSRDILARVPQDATDRACICPACAAK
ncbi:MAG TPA: cysteine-rich CWC family protein [Ramlibacter sp.]|nr:cysteine-rich CWC family protein [Ramlibacter sp.]